MNKRIKNKVTKRIINKMQSKNSLTEFEKKFFDKHLCDSFSNIATEFLDSFISVMTRWLEYKKKKVEEQITELDVAEKNGVEQAEWFSEVDLAEGPDMTVQSIVEIQKQSKWQKAKGKVKGWFGK